MKKLLLSLFIILGVTQFSNAQNFSWVLKNVAGISFTTDINGNIYYLKETNNKNIQIGDSTYEFKEVPITYNEVYAVAKLTPAGNVTWVRRFAVHYDGSDPISVPKIDVANDGNIYITGTFDTPTEALFGESASTDVVKDDNNDFDKFRPHTFTVKLNSSGYFVWLVANKLCESTDNYRTIAFDPVNGTTYYNGYEGVFETYYHKVTSNGTLTTSKRNPITADDNYVQTYTDPSKNYLYANNGRQIAYCEQRTFGNDTFGMISFLDDELKRVKSIKFNNTVYTGVIFPLAAAIDEDLNSYVVVNGIESSVIEGFQSDKPGGTTSYLLKVDSTGDWKWMVSLYTDSTENAYPNIIYQNGKIYLAGYNKNNKLLTIGNLNTGGQGDKGYLAEITTDGNVLSLKSYPIRDPFFIKTTRSFPLLTGRGEGSLVIDGTSENLTGINFLASYEDVYSNIIHGIAYYDINNNQLQDVNELDYKELLINIDGPEDYVTNTNNTGKYAISTEQTGNYTVIPLAPKYYTVVPTQHAVNIIDTTLDSSYNFRIVPVANINDLEVHLSNVTFARPGFTVTYRLTAKNVGTTILNPTVKLVYDNDLGFNNAGPQEDNHTGSELSWDITNLKPGENKDFTVNFTLSTGATLGDSLCSFSTITPVTGDTTEDNNVDTLYQIIRGAYDPNIKETSRPEIINVANVNGSFPIDYTIHFQNTGTDTAFHVYLIDSLDADLKVESIEVLSASHDYQMSISENNTLRWDYYNILLVDSNTNEPMSHGFVKYRVWTKDNPGLGDEFTNFADIYFDFNEPVRTNTTSNRIDKIESVELVKGKTVIVYPNPSNGVFTVKADIKAGTNAKVEVMDLTGKLVTTQNVVADANGLETPIDINTLPQGIYFVKIYANNEVYTAKVIKQ